MLGWLSGSYEHQHKTLSAIRVRFLVKIENKLCPALHFWGGLPFMNILVEKIQVFVCVVSFCNYQSNADEVGCC